MNPTRRIEIGSIRVLKLLQWHCTPILWQLRTPVHMFALGAFVEVYPNARFLWSHRDPAKVLGSVCSLIPVVRSWSSDYRDPDELGAEQLAWWVRASGGPWTSARRSATTASSDVSFADLQTDPVAVADSYEAPGLTFTDATLLSKSKQWADGHRPAHVAHTTYDLADFGLTEGRARGIRATTSRTYDATA